MRTNDRQDEKRSRIGQTSWREEDVEDVFDETPGRFAAHSVEADLACVMKTCQKRNHISMLILANYSHCITFSLCWRSHLLLHERRSALADVVALNVT